MRCVVSVDVQCIHQKRGVVWAEGGTPCSITPSWKRGVCLTGNTVCVVTGNVEVQPETRGQPGAARSAKKPRNETGKKTGNGTGERPRNRTGEHVVEPARWEAESVPRNNRHLEGFGVPPKELTSPEGTNAAREKFLGTSRMETRTPSFQ